MSARGDPAERSASAGEYVLGTLGADERADFEAALRSDAALQAEVYAWQDRLLGLARRVAPAAAAPGGWDAIEARLAADGRDATRPAAPAGAPGGLALAAPPASTDTAQVGAVGRAPPAANDPQWRRLRRWQLASAVGLAASLLLATLLFLRGPAGSAGDGAAPQRYLALLQSPADRDTGWIVEATAGGTVRLIPLAGGAAAAVPAGKALQFWTKAEDAAGPTSLGLVAAGTPVTLPASRLPALGERQLFELTLEPAAGSPLDRPTGPVLYLGRSVRL